MRDCKLGMEETKKHYKTLKIKSVLNIIFYFQLDFLEFILRWMYLGELTSYNIAALKHIIKM